ncbi:MAG: DNA replication/repair protein RecF [Legionellaceae bacterium]|nr:DNA replication/repair protein RecF [Legionellaceae bacterium]
MSLRRLDIHHVRNITSARLALNPRFNIFYGQNGSGKTSLLESLYLLGSGHSFRTRENAALVSYEQENLTIFGELITGDSISIQKSLTGTKVRLNHQPCRRSSDLARHLPCQIFYQDIFEIMDAGPAVRRNLLDWGLFHVKPEYNATCKDYKRVLKHRNALLKQGTNRRALAPWDEQLVTLSYVLDAFRSEYFEHWSEAFNTVLEKLTSLTCRIHYEKGWDKQHTGQDLASILTEQFERDAARQYTHSGAHQADILFETAGTKAKQTLSRGQQKMILIAMKLAQAEFLSTRATYLFDDVTTELDSEHVQRLFDVIDQIEGQFFFTSISPDIFQEKLGLDKSVFFRLDGGEVSRET